MDQFIEAQNIMKTYLSASDNSPLEINISDACRQNCVVGIKKRHRKCFKSAIEEILFLLEQRFSAWRREQGEDWEWYQNELNVLENIPTDYIRPATPLKSSMNIRKINLIIDEGIANRLGQRTRSVLKDLYGLEKTLQTHSVTSNLYHGDSDTVLFADNGLRNRIIAEKISNLLADHIGLYSF